MAASSKDKLGQKFVLFSLQIGNALEYRSALFLQELEVSLCFAPGAMCESGLGDEHPYLCFVRLVLQRGKLGIDDLEFRARPQQLCVCVKESPLDLGTSIREARCHGPILWRAKRLSFHGDPSEHLQVHLDAEPDTAWHSEVPVSYFVASGQVLREVPVACAEISREVKTR